MRSSLLVFIVSTIFVGSCFGESLFKQDNIRVVFVGDSITGQGGGWVNTGFVFQIEKALKEIYPKQQRELIPLGGSGSGLHSWIQHEKASREKERRLDIKKFELKKNLNKPTDILIVMLGMNDVLAPYIGDDEASLEKWQRDYLALVTTLQTRTKAKTTAVATISMDTEDPASPKNLLIERMNQLIRELAKQHHFVLLPVNSAVWDTLQKGRKINPRFHITKDFVHPNLAGHIAVAAGMLKGLGEIEAAAFLEDDALGKVWQAESQRQLQKNKSAPPAAWLLAAKLPQPFWKGNTFQADKARTPIDDAIEAQSDFTRPIDVGQGQTLQWKEYRPSINYTGEDQPGSIDFSAITHAKNFEGGYGAQWIKSPDTTAVEIHLSSDMFAGNMHVTLWLNGKQIHQSALMTKTPTITIKTTLQKGWNTLVFKASHRTWQWQLVVDVTAPQGDKLAGLEYSAHPQPSTHLK